MFTYRTVYVYLPYCVCLPTVLCMFTYRIVYVYLPYCVCLPTVLCMFIYRTVYVYLPYCVCLPTELCMFTYRIVYVYLPSCVCLPTVLCMFTYRIVNKNRLETGQTDGIFEVVVRLILLANGRMIFQLPYMTFFADTARYSLHCISGGQPYSVRRFYHKCGFCRSDKLSILACFADRKFKHYKRWQTTEIDVRRSRKEHNDQSRLAEVKTTTQLLLCIKWILIWKMSFCSNAIIQIKKKCTKIT